MSERSCEFCVIGQHAVEDCQLLKRMTGVRFDPETRQVFWSICTKHRFWSTDSHADCELCVLEAKP